MAGQLTGWDFYIYDPGPDPRPRAPLESDDLAEAILREMRSRTEADGGAQKLRMPDVCAGGHVGFEFALGALSSLTAPGLAWIGGKIHAFFKSRGRGASGDAVALRLVAIYHLAQRHPEVVPDIETIEQIGEPVSPDIPARQIQAVVLYRIRDTRSVRVFVVEVSSVGDLVTLAERERVQW